ncbi:hypothetical protein [Embleya sp. NPDC059237]|uniref:hypothetical protein n=1 Tax=Embleya sp. NPDC059237 TaxID=3346784 RepID=UPI00368D6187
MSLWYALTAMAGLPHGAPPQHVTAMVDRLRCVGWGEPDDELWFVHIAMEDPEQGITWVLNGQDFD